MILASHGIIASQIASFDADAVAFFGRVTTAGGTLSTTEKQAVNQLVVTMKADGTWGPCKAIYPMVGASAAACAQNLRSSSFTGSFSSGWTFSSQGASTMKSSGSYMDTGLLASSNLTPTNTHNSYYNNLAVTGDQNILMGDNAVDGNWIGLYQSSNQLYGAIANSFTSVTLGTPTTAFYLTNKQNSTTLKFIKNSSIIGTQTVVTTSFSSTQNVYLNNYQPSPTFSSGSRCAFASIGNSLTDTQASNLYTAVQAFQTTLSRQV
jgi:hypothetical protein